MLKIDLLDNKILYHLDINARTPLTQLAKKTNSSISVVEYRMKRMEKEGLIKNYLTFLDAGKLGLTIWNVYLEFKNTNSKIETDIKEYLISLKNSWWIAECSGKWDLIFSIGIKDIKEFYRIVSGLHNKFGENILNQNIEAHTKIEIISRGFFLNKPGKNKEWYKEIENVKINETDKKILKLISKNARLSSVEIAKQTKTTARIVAYRIKELLKKNIIHSFRLDLNLKKINMNFYKIILKTKNISSKKIENLKQYCINEYNIIHFEEKIGSWMLELELNSKSYEKADEQIKRMKELFPNFIESYEIILIKNEIKSELDLTKII
jgi:DNA-binding Lrp family transcriptional regulator